MYISTTFECISFRIRAYSDFHRSKIICTINISNIFHTKYLLISSNPVKYLYSLVVSGNSRIKILSFYYSLMNHVKRCDFIISVVPMIVNNNECLKKKMLKPKSITRKQVRSLSFKYANPKLFKCIMCLVQSNIFNVFVWYLLAEIFLKN